MTLGCAKGGKKTSRWLWFLKGIFWGDKRCLFVKTFQIGPKITVFCCPSLEDWGKSLGYRSSRTNLGLHRNNSKRRHEKRTFSFQQVEEQPHSEKQRHNCRSDLASKRYLFVGRPPPCNSVTSRVITCLGSGIPINLHFPLLQGGGHIQGIYKNLPDCSPVSSSVNSYSFSSMGMFSGVS